MSRIIPYPAVSVTGIHPGIKDRFLNVPEYGIFSSTIHRCLREYKKNCRKTGTARIYSSSVEISPGSIPISFALRTRRTILPLRVLGRLSTNSISDGMAIGPSVIRTW